MKAAIKNIDLLQAVNRGLLNLNTSDLTAEDGYKVFRTLKALRKAAEAFEESRKELVRSKVSDEEQEKARAYDEAKDKSAEGLITAEERKAIAGRVAEAGKAVLPLLNDTSEVEVRPGQARPLRGLVQAQEAQRRPHDRYGHAPRGRALAGRGEQG